MAQAPGSLPSDPRDLLEIAWRRKWLILVPFLLLGASAAFLARALPSVYRSSTVILVEKPKVPEAYIRSTVTTRIEDRLATITQQILSRTWLERVITQLDLYRDERTTLPMEAVVERMRRDIEVQVRGSDAFTIFYRGRDPKIVRDVTTRLAALYIEENSKVREEQAVGTSEFLETQLAALKQTLTVQESQVREFKERYMGELPQQQEANLRALDRMQLYSQSLADQIRAAEERRLLLQTQLAQTPRVSRVVVRVMRPLPSVDDPRPKASPVPVLPGAAVPVAARDPVLLRLEEARTVLAQLQSRYTDRHPDVMRAKRQLEDMEALAAGRSGTLVAPVAGASDGLPEAGETAKGERLVPVEEVQEVPNPIYAQVEAQLAALGREIEALRTSQGQTLAQIRAAQRKVENVPKLEQQLMELTRDYDNTRRTYESLLAKKLDAQLAQNLEKRQKGEQFRVLDPAVLPQTPYRPNRTRILVLGLAFGLGVGVAGAAGLEALDHSVRNPRELKHLLPGLRLIGTVPLVADPGHAWRRWLVRLGVALVVLAGGATAVAATLRFRDEIVRLGVFEFLLR